MTKEDDNKVKSIDIFLKKQKNFYQKNSKIDQDNYSKV